MRNGIREERFLSFLVFSAPGTGGGAVFFLLPITVPRRLFKPGFFFGVSLIPEAPSVTYRDSSTRHKPACKPPPLLSLTKLGASCILSLVILGGGGIAGTVSPPAEFNLPTVLDAELRLLASGACRGSVRIRVVKILISSAISILSRALRHSSAGFLFCSILSTSCVWNCVRTSLRWLASSADDVAFAARADESRPVLSFSLSAFFCALSTSFAMAVRLP